VGKVAAPAAPKAAAKPVPAHQPKLISGGTPVTKEEFAMFQQALKESPPGSWAPRKHAVVNSAPLARRIAASAPSAPCPPARAGDSAAEDLHRSRAASRRNCHAPRALCLLQRGPDTFGGALAGERRRQGVHDHGVME
jgi:hypothetical protein